MRNNTYFKIGYSVSMVLIAGIFFVFGLHTLHSQAQATVFRTFPGGIQVGDSASTIIDDVDQNLIYGLISNNSVQGNLFLLEHGSGVPIFRIGLNGDIISRTGSIDVSQVCIQADCKNDWAEVAATLGNPIDNQNTVVQNADFWISGSGELGSLRIASGGDISISVSNTNPIVVRNSTDTQDLFVISQTGQITGNFTIKGNTVGNNTGNIPWNAGQGILNQDLNANYIEGNDWNDLVSYVQSQYPVAPTPDKHYFISTNTTNANAGGYTGLDSLCTNDAKAIPGRSYHVWADNSGRNFEDDVIYSNAVYGTFERASGVPQANCVDPDIGTINCDTVWLQDSPSTYTWNTSINSCNDWNGLSGGANRIFRAFDAPNAAGTVSGNSGFVGCANSYHVLCIEDSVAFTDPGSVCGDGFITTGEDCDDDNTIDDASCPANCKADGGFCGDGYHATDETCEYSKTEGGITLLTRNKCTNSCEWAADTDGDGFDGIADCWNRATNNDDLAFPGSENQSFNLSKDMNCDGTISSNVVCNQYTTMFDYAHDNSPEYTGINTTNPLVVACPSPNTKVQADAFCDARFGSEWSAYWWCNGAPFWEVGCRDCIDSDTYYW